MAKYEPSHLKEMNTKIVFEEFRNHESLFVNEIARTTKISVPTVMKIVDFLIEKQLVKTREEEFTNVKAGRKPNMLKLNNGKYYSVGMIYEGDYLTLGIVDFMGTVQNFIQVRCGQHFETSIFQNIDKLLEMSGRNKGDLTGIGIGIPCIFNNKTREITAPLIGIHEPKYWGDTIDRIAEKYDAKVIIDNDLNIQAFGEYASYRPSVKEDLIFLSLGTGFGAGVIIDGKARKGSRNICGEIGYMMYEYSEEKQESGWLEERINMDAIKSRFHISENSCREEDKKAAVDYISGYLAMTVNNLLFCYDVSNIVLDGNVIELLGNDIIEETQKKLNKICFNPVLIKRKNILFPGISGAGLLAGNAWLNEILK